MYRTWGTWGSYYDFGEVHILLNKGFNQGDYTYAAPLAELHSIKRLGCCSGAIGKKAVAVNPRC